MAILPSSANISGPENMRSGRTIAQIDTTGLGRGVAQAGAAIRSLGVDLTREQKERQQQENTVDVARAEALKTKGFLDTENEFNADGDYSTFDKRAPVKTGDVVKTAADVIRDPKMKERWAIGAGEDALRVNDSIGDKGRALGKQAETAAFDDALETSRRIFVDPNVDTKTQEKAKADIEGALQTGIKSGLLTPAEADARRKFYVEDANFSRGKLAAEKDPTIITAPLPADESERVNNAISFFVSKGWTKEQAGGIVGNLMAESRLNTLARNPGDGTDGSDSIGVGQWNGNRASALKAFAVANKSDWRDLGTQLAFVHHELETSESAAGGALKNAKNVDEAAAAFAGYERPAGWSSDNPRGAHNYKGRLKYAMQAAGVEGNPEWFKDLSPEQRSVVLNVADAQQRQNDTAAAALVKAQADAAKDNYYLRIANVDPTLTVNEINADPNIDAGQKAGLINSLNSKNKDELSAAAAVKAYSDGSLVVDPYSPEGKKAVDAVSDAITKAVPPEQQQSATEGLIQSTGLVPQKTFNGIRAGLESTNIADIEKAAQQAQRISTINPAALSRRDGGASVQKIADDYSYYVNTLNLSSTQAAQRIADANDPAKQRDRKALEPAAKEFKKQIESQDIGAMFDTTLTPFDTPSLGINESQALGIQADYLAIAEEQFFQTNGNVELAKNRAQEEMKRLYGVSSLSGSNVVVKHPPERYWPVVNGDTTLQYAKTQLYQELYAIDPGIADSKIQLVTTPATDAMIKRGEMPAYAVFYQDKNGNYQTMPGKLWRPDPTGQLKMQEERKAAEQGALTDQARFQQGINRTAAEMQNDPQGARDASLDSFIDGPNSTPQQKFEQNKGKKAITSNTNAPLPGADNALIDSNIDPMGNGF